MAVGRVRPTSADPPPVEGGTPATPTRHPGRRGAQLARRFLPEARLRGWMAPRREIAGRARTPADRRREVAMYGLAVAGILVAYAADIWIPALHRAPLMLLLCAVVVTGWYGGLRPGLVSVASGAVASALVLQQAAPAVAPNVADDAVRVVVFVVTAGIAVWLTAGLRSAREAAAADAARARASALAARESQIHLLTVLDSAADPIAAVDQRGQLLFANSAAMSFFRDAADGADEDLQAFLRGDVLLDADGCTLDPDEQPATKALQGGQAEASCRVASGSDAERWVAIKATPIRDDGRIAGAVIAWRDATSEHEAEAAREAFMGVLAHELRTPITTVYGGAHLLVSRGERLPGATKREIAADVLHEATRLHRIAENLLVLSRFERGQLEVVSEPVILEPLVRTVVASEASRWPTTHFDIEIDLATRVPVLAAPGYVEQILRNLLSNAAKYGEGTPVSVRMSEQGGEIEVSVSDRGPGFPPESADHLFELYYRCPGTAEKAPGSGIGLYVCRRLIEAMGGRIWAAARDGGGATFSFTLEAIVDDAVPADEEPQPVTA